MQSRQERLAANKASAERNSKLREQRKLARDEKKMIKARLSASTSSAESRQIKSGAIYDLSTNQYVKKKEFPDTGKRPLQDDGIDFVSRGRPSSGGDSSGGGGGGLPDGFAEETLDIVDSNNLAAQRIFLTKDVV